MIQLRHLRYFVGIVDAGSLSRAATTLYVAQPALSQQMAELEQELGVPLLHRSVRDGGGEVAGAVSLGMSSTVASFLAGPFIEACRAALPRVSLSLVTEDSLTLKSRIDAHGLDLAVVFEQEAAPGQGLMPLFRQRLFLVDRKKLPGHPRAVPLQLVATLPLVLASRPNALRSVLDRALAEAGLQPKVVVETNLLSSMLAAVHSGAGATVVPLGDFSALLASVITRLLRDKAPVGMEPVEA